MQAIILAAGMGRRLGDLTRGHTKCMVEVNGQTLIDRAIHQLSKLNLTRLVLVVGYKGKELKEYIGNRYDDILKIEYIENPIYDRTNNIYSLALAKDILCEDDSLLLESDLIFEDSMLDMLVNHPDPNLALVAKYETWMDGTMVRIDSERNIVNFVPKAAFRFEDVSVYYKTVNIYKFSKEFSQKEYVPFLDAYSKVMGNNEYYEQVLRVITLVHNSTLKALPIGDKKWYEIDDIQDLDIASAIFSEHDVKYGEYHKRYGGYWRFPNLLDYCYLVNPFFPPKRMLDEMKANFDTLLREYPSGQWVNSLLAAKYFGIRQDYIIVGNGAAELIKSFAEAHENERIGVIFPTFDEYPNRFAGAEVIPFIPQKKDFRYDAEDLMEFFGDKDINTLLLINPDNPSGNFITIDNVIMLTAWCKEKGIALLVDESFVDFTDGFENNSLLHNDILESYPNLSVMKSISKSYGVPGLRLGVFATADRQTIQRMKKDVSIWNINSFGEFYMQIYGKYEKDYNKACHKFIAERERFYSLLQQIPYLHVMPSQANYFLCEVTERFTSKELTQILLDHDVLISNCGRKKNMGDRNLVRIAVRSMVDNDNLLSILESL
mgnify:FL=1